MELTILLQLDALSGREKTVHEVALQFVHLTDTSAKEFRRIFRAKAQMSSRRSLN
jgi:hypothetical protein